MLENYVRMAGLHYGVGAVNLILIIEPSKHLIKIMPNFHILDAGIGVSQNIRAVSDTPSPSQNSHITVRVSNHDSPSSSPEKISPENKSRGSFSPLQLENNNSPHAATSLIPANSSQSQTLSDLKKQRSMSRVKQHSPSQQEHSPSHNVKHQNIHTGTNSKAANANVVETPGQLITVNSSVAFHNQTTDSPTTLLKTSSGRNNSKKNSPSRKTKSKAPTHPKAVGKNVHSKTHKDNTEDHINIDANHHSPKKLGSRSSTNVKKFSAGTNEVVGPPQKKTGCCKIM